MSDPYAWQSEALAAFRRNRGVFVAMGLGRGKTHVAAQIYHLDAGPALWIGPASTRKSANKACRLQGLPEPGFMSYSAIGCKGGGDALERWAPKRIILDEVHKAKNVRDSAVGRRLARYISTHPEVEVAAFSGSIIGSRMREWAPPVLWALRSRVRSAIPTTLDRCIAVDERLQNDDEGYRRVVENLARVDGVFLDLDSPWDGAVDCRRLAIPNETDLLKNLREKWVLPDGAYVSTWWELVRAAGQIGRGFWYEPTTRPPKDYLDARAEWARVVTKGKYYGMADTEATMRDMYPGAYMKWQAIESLYPTPETRPVFYDDTAADVARWFRYRSTEERGIIWVRHIALGERLSSALGLPYFHEGATDARGRHLEAVSDHAVIASIEACGTGLNLQGFSRNLFIEIPPGEDIMHQAIGRTARSGQRAARVSVEVLITCNEDDAALDGLVRSAQRIETRTGQHRYPARF